MLSYQDLKQQFLRNIGKAGSSDTNVLADFDSNLANRYQMILAKLKNYTTQNAFSFNTVDGTQYYKYPARISKIVNAVVTIGSVRYTLQPIYSQEKWDQLNALQIQPTAIPQFIFARRTDFGVWPIPRGVYSSVLNYFERFAPPSVDDYTDGTITVTNADNTVTGLATTFTADMAGRYLQVTTPTAVGHGVWYRVASYTSGTEIELDIPFEGATAGTLSYKICDVPQLPEESHILLCDGATADFYAGARVDSEKFTQWNNKFFTGDMNNNTRDWNSDQVIGGLIGLIRSYADRDDSHLVRMQPKSTPPSYKVWATSLSM